MLAHAFPLSFSLFTLALQPLIRGLTNKILTKKSFRLRLCNVSKRRMKRVQNTRLAESGPAIVHSMSQPEPQSNPRVTAPSMFASPDDNSASHALVSLEELYGEEPSRRGFVSPLSLSLKLLLTQANQLSMSQQKWDGELFFSVALYNRCLFTLQSGSSAILVSSRLFFFFPR